MCKYKYINKYKFNNNKYNNNYKYKCNNCEGKREVKTIFLLK